MQEKPDWARPQRAGSLAFVCVAYAAALVVAVSVLGAMSGTHPLVRLGAADVAATLVVFAFSMALRNGSVYDPYWSVVPPFIALYWLANATAEAVPTRQLLVTLLVFAWGIRLTCNWGRGWPGLRHEDWRYVELYANALMPRWLVSLLGIHLFPTLQVFLGCLALVPALAVGGNAAGVLDVLALLVTAGAIAIETIADEQLRAFNCAKKPGEILRRGLWAYSRHPNYFGELGFWWGLFLFAVAADAAWWWTIVGPAAMTAMFVFASIPMLDRRSLERRPGYAEHMRRVSAVVPWWPRRG